MLSGWKKKILKTFGKIYILINIVIFRIWQGILWESGNTVETVVLLSREKIDGYVSIDLDVEKRANYNLGSGEGKKHACPAEKEEAIMDAFKHFNLI